MKRGLWLAGLVVVVGCGSSAREEPSPPAPVASPAVTGKASTHFRLCNAGEPTGLDPALVSSVTSIRLLDPLFDGLTTHGPDGEAVASLATDWDASEDWRRWTFRLRKDARWSNGRPIVAEDFVYALARLLSMGWKSPNIDEPLRLVGARAYMEGKGKEFGARTVDDHTLEFRFEDPNPDFLAMSSSRAWRPVPREAIQAHGDAWTRPENLVSSGPFRLASWAPRDRIELTRSETFWGRASVRLSRVTVFAQPSRDEALEMYKRGDCDALVANHVPPEYVRSLKKTDPLAKELEVHDYLGVYLLMVQSERLSNVHVRRALAMAVDRDKVIASLGGDMRPTHAISPTVAAARLSKSQRQRCGQALTSKRPVMPQHDGCYLPPDGLPYDPRAAKAEWAKAAAELGDKQPARISYLFNELPGHRAVGEELARQWKEVLGIDVSVDAVPWKNFLALTNDGNYEVARMGWILNYPSPLGELLPQFRCTAPDNRTRFCDEELEETLRVAGLETNPDKRRALVYGAERRLLESAAVIPIYVYSQHRLTKPYVRGWALNIIDRPNLRDVWIAPH